MKTQQPNKYQELKKSLFCNAFKPFCLFFAICALLPFALNELALFFNLPTLINQQTPIEYALYYAIASLFISLIASAGVYVYLQNHQLASKREIEKFGDILCQHIEQNRPFKRLESSEFVELEQLGDKLNFAITNKQKQEYFHIDGMANEKYFRYQLEQIPANVRQDFLVAVVYLDRLDSTLRLLSRSSHKQLLSSFSKRLNSFASMLSCAKIARVSNDEYLIAFASKSPYEDTAKSIFAGLQTCFNSSIDIAFGIGVQLKLGLCMLGESVDNSIANARLARLNCKKDFCIYNTDLNDSKSAKEQICAELARAIANEQLIVQYQPKLDSSARIIGAEALVRWRRADGFFNTECFVKIAETNGLIIQLERLVISKVCSDLAQLLRMGLLTKISINLSAEHLAHESLQKYLEDQLRLNNLEPCNIELEITERGELNAKAHEQIASLSKAGFAISLDDFGKDYNSLSRMSVLPFNIVKVDKMFVDGLDPKAPNHDISVKVVKGIINMAKDLGKQIIAEGVETAEQIDILRQLGCDAYQGFYHYKSLDFDDFSKVLLVKASAV